MCESKVRIEPNNALRGKGLGYILGGGGSSDRVFLIMGRMTTELGKRITWRKICSGFTKSPWIQTQAENSETDN
jgi:hypothetical protein